MAHNGYPMTGRNPAVLAALIADPENGDNIWLGPDGAEGRYDRDSLPEIAAEYAATRKEPPMPDQTKTAKPSTPTNQVKQLVGLLRTAVLGTVAIDPVDADAPVGTQFRRMTAYNALHELAKPGRDRFCANRSAFLVGPCVLKAGHEPSQFDDATTCMDAAQRDRALRYLVHSEPDPQKRA